MGSGEGEGRVDWMGSREREGRDWVRGEEEEVSHISILCGINYRLPTVTLIVAVGIYFIVHVVKQGSNTKILPSFLQLPPVNYVILYHQSFSIFHLQVISSACQLKVSPDVPHVSAYRI